MLPAACSSGLLWLHTACMRFWKQHYSLLKSLLPHLAFCLPLHPMQATVRAWGFRGARMDASALAAALRATVTDLPFLAGRWVLLHCVPSAAAAAAACDARTAVRCNGMPPLAGAEACSSNLIPPASPPPLMLPGWSACHFGTLVSGLCPSCTPAPAPC